MVAIWPCLAGDSWPRGRDDRQFCDLLPGCKAQDPVINTQAYVPAEDESSARNIGAAPAMQARNHAATGVMPEAKDKK